MEESLLGKSQFVGRDGFRWWIGQIAPRKSQPDQLDEGKGWSNRYKVRIMGYHPMVEEGGIANEELPWAICLLPTTAGAGGANYQTSTILQQGDVVFGFFLDGDDAQVPAILGVFGRPDDVDDDGEYTAPFEPYTAFTDTTPVNPKTEKDPETGVPNQSGEQNEKSQPTNSSATTGQHIDQDGSGENVITPDTCSTSSVSRMAQALENMGRRVEEFSLTGQKLEAEIDAVADLVETQANGFVGRMMDATYDHIEPKLQEGLEKLYEDTFGKVFAQMGNTPQSYSLAHSAGRAAQIGEIPKIKNVENALACVGNKVVEGLRGTVADMLKDLLKSGLGISGCVATNFAASFLNKITNGIADGLKSPLSGLGNIFDIGIDIGDFLRSSSLVLEDFSGFLDCGQTNKDKCPPIRKYQIAGGPLEKGADPFSYVSYQMNKTAEGIGGITDAVGGIVGAAQGLASGGLSNIAGNVVSNALGGGLLGGAASSLIGGGGIRGALTGGLKSKFGNLVPPGVTKTLGGFGEISALIEDLSAGGSCVGGKQNCGSPKMQIFGGGGIGAIGKVVLGKTIENSGLGGIADGISKTASIIGVNIQVPGRNYKSPPAISFTDKCGIGAGAHGHAIIEDGKVVGVVIDTTGDGYPVVEEPDVNVGVTTVYVENGGTGYVPGDKIDETVNVFPVGFPDPITGTASTVTITPEPPRPDPTDPTVPLPPDVPDPFTELVPEPQRVTLTNAKDRPTYELVVDPETGSVVAVKVLNILKYQVPPVLKILSENGRGAVLRPIFGDIPPARQEGVLTVIDCIGKS